MCKAFVQTGIAVGERCVSIRRRAVLSLLAGLPLAACGTPAFRTDVAYSDGPGRRLDVYRPSAGGDRLPLVIFFHGGAWAMGGKEQLPEARFARDLSEFGAVVVSADYGLYPDTRFPGFLEDAALALAWARSHAGELGADPSATFAIGHSAGAYIAAMLALDGRWGGAGGDLAGAIGVSGPYGDWIGRHPAIRGVFANAAAERYLPSGFAGPGRPPLLLLCGSSDWTVGARDSLELAQAVQKTGGEAEARVYLGFGHLDILAAGPWMPSLAPTLADTWSFISRRTRVIRG